MRRLVAARLRHQPAQAVLVTVLAALVSLSAVLGVAYAAAVETSVQHQTLADAAVSAGFGLDVVVHRAHDWSPPLFFGIQGMSPVVSVVARSVMSTTSMAGTWKPARRRVITIAA